MMGFTRNYLVSLFLYVFIVNEIRQPAVTCQDEEGSQCIPKKTFLALLRLPEVSSNLAAYSRTARIIQETKNHNDIAHLKALSSEENDDAEICIPGGLYLELFKDPALRGHLSVMARTHKLPEFPGRLLDDSEEIDSRDLIPESEKRSLATLAKNDDLPVTIQEREDDDDEEKRSIPSSGDADSLMRILLGDDYHRRGAGVYDYLGDLDPEVIEYPLDKRNIGSLARDFALPTGRRHIGSVARDYGLPNGKRNIGSLARQSMLPPNGKRNIGSLARYSMLPTGKRNVAALARDSSLPYGKRYLGSLVRNGGYPVRGYDDGKRNVASLARNADWPGFVKRGGTAPGRMMVRVLNRHGRSLSDDREAQSEPLDLQQLIRQGYDNGNDAAANVASDWTTPFSVSENLDESRAKNRSNRRIDAALQARHKRQIDFSDEYPLPVVQNTNMLDYEDMMEALTDHYPNAEKRFMGSAPEMPADSGYPEVLPPSKRHIGALARLGWLPSFRTPRFSRSPRYLVEREDPADGSSSNYTPNASARSLRPMFTPKTRYLHGDCRRGFRPLTRHR
ncbi:neuropeptide-like 1 isoform X1 [Pogonomyrmex barbatus]|uniref:Neuropeptide-like 1 isoform X1 n=1 Tax=Pogonomyrmex barbatus TaxID=144034 RepID=A0A6I9WV99_9HYME|nr:neuropeptide-like 1 isoform X1 [Pogonomyrmex barbatus]